MPELKPLSTTSYAVLGLLAIKPWTTYELAKQMEVSLRNFWPRAESKLYEEPKKLVAHGLATVSREAVGNRPRSIYRITGEGRRMLRAWLDEPGALPAIEFEALIKVFFAEHGSKSQLVKNLQRIRDGARSRAAVDAAWAEHYLSTGGTFPERLAVLSLVGPLQAGLNQSVLTWAEWALETVAGWPEDLRQAPAALEALEQIRRGSPWTGATPTGPHQGPTGARPAPQARPRSAR